MAFSGPTMSLSERLVKPRRSLTPAAFAASMTFWCCCIRSWKSLVAIRRTRSTSAIARASESAVEVELDAVTAAWLSMLKHSLAEFGK